VSVKVDSFEWGTIGAFVDPDGNRCELRNHFDGFFAPKR
jgi:lactoylglutathione lyase